VALNKNCDYFKTKVKFSERPGSSSFIIHFVYFLINTLVVACTH